MNKLNCLIIDDEPLALDILQEYAERTPFLKLLGRCSSAVEAAQYFHNSMVDLVFLDIQMPEINEMEFAKTLVKGPKVVFTTAFITYAVEGYKVEAVDYLLKPFSYKEFLQAATKALERHQLEQGHREEELEYIYVKADYKQIKIVLSQVLYFEGLKDYVKIYIEGQSRPILSLLSLKSLEEQLPSKSFMRVHRSFIVNLNKIESVEKGQLIVKGVPITVADNYKEKFNQFLSNRSI